MPILEGTKTVTCNIGYQCNRCSREATHEDDPLEWQEFLHWERCGGYASVFGDGVELSLTLCQHCVKELLDAFVWSESE